MYVNLIKSSAYFDYAYMSIQEYAMQPMCSVHWGHHVVHWGHQVVHWGHHVVHWGHHVVHTVCSVDEDDFLVLLSENAAQQIYTKWVDTLEVCVHALNSVV